MRKSCTSVRERALQYPVLADTTHVPSTVPVPQYIGVDRLHMQELAVKLSARMPWNPDHEVSQLQTLDSIMAAPHGIRNLRPPSPWRCQGLAAVSGQSFSRWRRVATANALQQSLQQRRHGNATHRKTKIWLVMSRGHCFGLPALNLVKAAHAFSRVNRLLIL
jgi:hypothetical protein